MVCDKLYIVSSKFSTINTKSENLVIPEVLFRLDLFSIGDSLNDLVFG